MSKLGLVVNLNRLALDLVCQPCVVSQAPDRVCNVDLLGHPAWLAIVEGFEDRELVGVGLDEVGPLRGRGGERRYRVSEGQRDLKARWRDAPYS